MVYTGELIKEAVAKGFSPGLVSGKKIVRLYICHKCKGRTMFKAYGPKSKVNVCRCGYRKKF